MDPRRIATLLKRIQWSVRKPGLRLPSCPDCFAMKPAHFDDCALARALADAMRMVEGIAAAEAMVSRLCGMSGEALALVWDNPTDAAYDKA